MMLSPNCSLNSNTPFLLFPFLFFRQRVDCDFGWCSIQAWLYSPAGDGVGA